MIHLVSGDILLTQAQVIVHGVAPNDPMTHGLSLAIHQHFPAMHKDFHHWCNHAHAKPGEAWLWGGATGRRIVNLVTQEPALNHAHHVGRATVKHVRDALKALRKMIDKEGLTSIALPRLATGVGGLQWNDVEPVIREVLGEVNIPVYVYADYHAGQKAQEPQH
jgi:O-acetyl-ADP-ribose deacetylase (regulator of RNase III)